MWGQSYPPSIAFAAAIVVGLLFGLANGLLVAVVRINPFITTVGSGFVINGVALVMTKNAAFLVDDRDRLRSAPGAGTAFLIPACF